MKRIIPLTLALLMLAACGAPGAEPTPTPAPSETPESLCETDFAAGPEDGAYTYTDEKLGLSLFIPDELAPNVAIAEGMEFFDENGDSISLYYIPQQSEHGCSLMKSIVRVPRGDYFDPERFYNRSIASFGVVAASEDSLYVLVDAIGGAAVSDETETVTIKDKDGKNKFFLDCKNGALEITTEKKITLKTGKCTVTIDGQGGEVSVECTKFTVKAQQQAAVTANQSLELSGGMLKAEGKQTAEFKGGTMAQLSAAMVKIN